MQNERVGRSLKTSLTESHMECRLPECGAVWLPSQAPSPLGPTPTVSSGMPVISGWLFASWFH